MTRVAIVGAGPAGLVAALALHAEGVKVQVFERRAEPTVGLDKPCGEGLMPPCVDGLRRLGVDLEGAGVPFRGIHYQDEQTVAIGTFGRGSRPGEGGSPYGLGVRRTTLSARLLTAVRDRGVDVEWERTVACEPCGDGYRLIGDRHEIPADVIVGADGLRSAVRASAALARPARGRARFGVRRHFGCTPWSDRVEVRWTDGVESYVTPVGADEVGVAMLFCPESLGSDPGPAFDRLLTRFPDLAARLDGAEPTRAWGCGPLRQPARSAVRKNVALIGDASGYVDAITGEGLALAVLQAPLLAQAVASGDLGSYDRAQRRARRLPEQLTEATLLLSRFPRLRRRTLRALHKKPALFDALLAHLCGEGDSLPRVAGSGVRLVGALLAA